MTTAIEVFISYAGAFEQTYSDDDWSRLEIYFSDDAVYEVRGGPLACRLTGPSAIFAGLKKSLDGMDRKSEERTIDVTDGPSVTPTDDGEEVSLGWHANYLFPGAGTTGFPGRTVAEVSNGKIVAMRDEYSDEALDNFAQWVLSNNLDIDGSYV